MVNKTTKINHKKMDQVGRYINKSKFYQIIFDKPLHKANIYKNTDQAFGRRQKPINPLENENRESGILVDGYEEYSSKYQIEKRNIYYQCWRMPNSEIISDVLLIHDINNHCSSFLEFMAPLIQAGFRVWCFDLPGHGRSDGVHGYVEQVEELMEAVEHLTINKIKQSINILGDGLGANLAFLYSLKFPNLTLKISAISPFTNHYNIKYHSSGLSVANYIRETVPRLGVISNDRLNNKLDGYQKIQFESDPLTYKKRIRCKTAFTVMDINQYLFNNLPEIKIPFMIQHGKLESMEFQVETKYFMDSTIQVKDKRLLLFNERERSYKTIFQMMINNTIDWFMNP